MTWRFARFSVGLGTEPVPFSRSRLQFELVSQVDRANGDAEARAWQVYQALMAPGPPGREHVGRYVHAGRARTSPLVWHLYGRNTSRPWDGDAVAQSAKPIPVDSPVPLSDQQRRTIVHWIDLGAAWDTGSLQDDSAPARTREGASP